MRKIKEILRLRYEAGLGLRGISHHSHSISAMERLLTTSKELNKLISAGLFVAIWMSVIWVFYYFQHNR